MTLFMNFSLLFGLFPDFLCFLFAGVFLPAFRTENIAACAALPHLCREREALPLRAHTALFPLY